MVHFHLHPSVSGSCTPITQTFPSLSLSLNDPNFWLATWTYAESLHAGMPFLTSLFRKHEEYSLPPSTLLFFEKMLSRERIRLALLDSEAAFATHLLEASRIPFIILKGMDISRRFYPNRMDRPMTDIDLLVSPSQYPAAFGTLIGQGYHSVGQHYPGRFRMELTRSPQHPILEIHSQLLNTDSTQRLTEYWDQAEKGQFSDLAPSTQVLSRTHCLTYLVQHAAAQHLIESPIWLRDIHYLIQKNLRDENLLWDAFLREIYRTQSRSAAWFLLRLIQFEWNTPIPVEVLQALQPTPNSQKYRFLDRRCKLDAWFSVSPRTWVWVLRSRYFLQDSFKNAVLTFFARWRIRLLQWVYKFY